MSNINLTILKKKEGGIAIPNNGLPIMIGFMVLLGIFYGWIVWSGSQAVKQTTVADKEYVNEKTILTSDKNLNVVDFQSRIIIAKELFNQENEAFSGLPNIEKTVVGGVYLKSLKYDKSQKIISIEGVADNYDVFAQQILSFKSLEKTDYLAGVNTGDSKIDEKGKVAFSMGLKLNNKIPADSESRN